MEVPDNAIWAAALSLAGTLVAGVKIAVSWISSQFDKKDVLIAEKDARIKQLEGDLVATTRTCADEKAEIVKAMSATYVQKVDQGADLDRSILQANFAAMSDFTTSVKELTAEVRGAGFARCPQLEDGGRT